MRSSRNVSTARGSAEDINAELSCSKAEAGDGNIDDSLGFCQQREQAYLLVAQLAEDLVSAPVSRAYVESFLCMGRSMRLQV